MIGSRTVGTLLVLVAALVAAHVFDLWSVAGRLDTVTLFWAGLLATIAGSFVQQLFSRRQLSVYYFRLMVGRELDRQETHLFGTDRVRIVVGSGISPDLPFWLHRGVYVAAAFIVLVGTFDIRSLDLLARFPEQIADAGGRLCKDPKTQPPPPVQDKIGCALVQRAYALGYSEDLGDCETTEEPVAEFCTLRHSDEPLLHYAWRRIRDFATGLSSSTNSDRLVEFRDEFAQRLELVEELYDEKRDVISAAPRSSHHIFTNLPNPGRWSVASEYQVSGSSACLERYRRLPHRPPRSGDMTKLSGRVFEHIFGQLMFETRYHDAVGYCPEYTIHWDSPVDVCNELVQDPPAYLASRGALDQVARVIARFERDSELSQLREESNLDTPELTSVVSFQCYIEERDRLVESYDYLEAQLGRTRFPVTELRVPALGGGRWIPAERYAYVASFLAPEFQYSQLYSQAPPAALRAERKSERFLDRREGYLSRLDQLTGVDVFLGESFLLERPDLLDIYPYHVHLENYVGLFRDVHREKRKRL